MSTARVDSIEALTKLRTALVKFAEAGGGHDNITVVVIDFDGDLLEEPRETDSFGYLQYPLVPSGTVAGAFSDEEITEASKPSGRFSHDALPALDPRPRSWSSLISTRFEPNCLLSRRTWFRRFAGRRRRPARS